MITGLLDKNIIYFIYSLRIIIFFNFNSSFIFWIWLEFNIVIFLIVIVYERDRIKSSESFRQPLYYFLLQSFCSTLFLFLISQDYIILKEKIILAVVIFKLGLIPFHFWIFKICEYLSLMPLFFLLNFQKIPLLIFLWNDRYKIVFYILLINLIFGITFLYKRKNITEFLIRSGICFMNWILFILIWNILGFILFLSKYFLFNFLFLRLKKFSFYNNYRISFFIKIFLLGVFLVGFPPIIFFYYKIYLIKFITLNFNFLFNFLIWIFSFLCLICYFNFFFFNFFNTKNLYCKLEIVKNKEIFMILTIFISINLIS